MDVPESVIDLLTGVRNHLQDKCEPPVYVSDRRFMKAIKMLQARRPCLACAGGGGWGAVGCVIDAVAEGEGRARWVGASAESQPATQAAPGSWLAHSHPLPACHPRLYPQVAARADGRSAVNEYDCLLLEFVLGQRPDDAHVSAAQHAWLPQPVL